VPNTPVAMPDGTVEIDGDAPAADSSGGADARCA
jgi:hypothetical protein